MPLTAYTGRGPLWPDIFDEIWRNTVPWTITDSAVIDAVGEQLHFFGQVYIYGSPAGTKTLSSGGGKLHFTVGSAITWATAGSTVRIGVQDLSTSAGPPARGDGTFDVYDDLVQGTDTLTVSAWKTVTMSSGTKSIAHGDLIDIVFEMTVVNGSDAVRVSTWAQSNKCGIPGHTYYASGAYGGGDVLPIVLIEFDDGTLGILSGTQPAVSVATESFADSTNPDERGLIFQTEDDIKVNEIVWSGGGTQAESDWEVKVYSDPLGTPSLMYSASFLGEQLAQTTVTRRFGKVIAAGSEISFSKNTDYAVMIKATSTGTTRLQVMTFADAAYRRFFGNGLQLRYGSRNNSTGAFSETTTKIPAICMRISSRETGGGGGAAAGSFLKTGSGRAATY